jgi:mRNA interferase HicA
MKRRDLIRHLENHGCEFLREGGNHTIYVNRRAQKSSAIPRHREIIEFLAQNLQRPGHSETVTLRALFHRAEASCPAEAQRRRTAKAGAVCVVLTFVS